MSLAAFKAGARALPPQQARCHSGTRLVQATTKVRRHACQAASAVGGGEPSGRDVSQAAATTSGATASAAASPAAAEAVDARDRQGPPAQAAGTAPAAAAGGAASSGTGAAAPADQPAASTTSTSAPRSQIFGNNALLRKLAAAGNIMDVADVLLSEVSSMSEEDARGLIQFYLQRGKPQLALALYREMCMSQRLASTKSAMASSSLDAGFAWPVAGLRTTTDLVLGLCQQLCIVEALQVLADLKGQGLPRGSEEVGFGKVITSPLAADRPLTVVQPQEGAKIVADGYSRYEFEVFSGTTISCNSTALNASGNILLGLGRALGLIKKPPVAAVHEFVLKAPDSSSRTFRVATDSAAVPAQVGERVTVVSAPIKNVRKGGIFNASPPGTRPGEAMTATNHKTGTVLQLLRPPVGNQQQGIPSWVLPVAVVLAGGDAASSLLDPSLPLLIAAGATTVMGSTVVGSTVLVPRLKQLPDAKVRVEYVRQQLLGQYSALAGKASSVLAESAEDVRFLARLWQLQNKMEAVGAVAPAPASTSAVGSGSGAGASTLSSSVLDSLRAGLGSSGGSGTSTSGGGGLGAAASFGGSAYEARIGRVSRARANIEERLARRIELLEGYSRVMNMIEIEVEMDIEVPAAEIAGIQQQVDRLLELESLQEDWRAQAEARDEVERLLRAA